MSQNYYELLQNPKWQKKRLEIMEKNKFTCQNCGESTKKLNVHHGAYLKDVLPWQYDDDWYHCLCDGCHADIHNAKTLLDTTISSFESYILHRLIGYSLGVWAEIKSSSNGYKIKIDNFEQALGLSDCLHIDLIKLFAKKDENGWIDSESIRTLINEKEIMGDENGRRKNVKKSHINKQKACEPQE